MVRRAHKKSRNGCLECKRRHVKCDEKRPICSNCTASERICEYGSRWINSTPTPRPAAPVSSLSGGTPTPVASPSLSPAATTPSPSGLSDEPPAVNMLHVELFHNLYSSTHRTFDPNGFLHWLPSLFSHAITTPYLVNEMLALSALHLSTLYPNKRDYYHYHAAQLQTHALSIFQDSNPQVTDETCVPLFLFSSIMGIHMLCDTLIYRENNDDFDYFVTRFAHYLRLHHGVRTILREAWPLLLAADSVVKPALDLGMALYKFDGALDPPLHALWDRITAANLGPELTDLYKNAVESLQVCTNVTSTTDNPHAGINGVITWPVLVKVEFGEALTARRPEALVILAHWAVLLYRYRDSWIFGDSGAYIIESVTRYLGDGWLGWLEGPLEVIHPRS
ncbi:Zn(II)2Cys6 transcription factor domain-containing protein [Aspergillus mulundensis]|uniref:Putative Zn(II)2Cys6 transcription factor n=1 Tax=Aspergillus mulundensis TaxID=1810919 RepID=A0A3D8T315_9EURO|nr:putative Zn(II)2Cys6 transcription factor [Aspergillus mulundensis]RDW92943.1 putative Zn(II)2Cys6 transcription factor [Aspergillus mulundensis]